MPDKKIALALCRVSSVDQLQNNSLSRQRHNVIIRAEKLDVIIPDDGWWSGSVSSKRGTNINRKDLQEMLERCRQNRRIEYIIVDEVDRFMRSMLEIGYYLVEFKRLGVTVVFASQPNLKTDTAANTLMLMLEAFKAEGSNEERQHKSIDGQTKALLEGRYTFCPKPGYRRGTQRGIPEVDRTRGPALQKVLLDIVEYRVSPTQGLIELNKSEFMSDGHSLYKMDKFRKIATDPFYAGTVEINKQVQVRNDNGLHEPLISREQHLELLKIFDAKKKNQKGPRRNGNPNYPLSNHVHCVLCTGKTNGRYVGLSHGNGQNPNLVYEKYRCRGCNRYLKKEELHPQIVEQFNRNPVTEESLDDLIEALDIVWKEKEGQAEQDTARIKHKIKTLGQDILRQVEAVTDPSNISIKDHILQVIDNKKAELTEFESELEELKNIADNDKQRFLKFAFGFVKDMGNNFLNTELVSQENRIRCKQLVFPAGFYLDKNNKVYTPEISLLYRLATKKKDAETSDISHMVRVTRLKLVASSLARKRSIN